jgi:hypothetical protein
VIELMADWCSCLSQFHSVFYTSLCFFLSFVSVYLLRFSSFCLSVCQFRSIIQNNVTEFYTSRSTLGIREIGRSGASSVVWTFREPFRADSVLLN